MCDPKLHKDLVHVLLRFRRYALAISSDISKMYVQIGLDPKDRPYFRFIWNGEDWQWNRQLFGKSDSPFIALHVIRGHALRHQMDYPLAATMYVLELDVRG